MCRPEYSDFFLASLLQCFDGRWPPSSYGSLDGLGKSLHIVNTRGGASHIKVLEGAHRLGDEERSLYGHAG